MASIFDGCTKCDYCLQVLTFVQLFRSCFANRLLNTQVFEPEFKADVHLVLTKVEGGFPGSLRVLEREDVFIEKDVGLFNVS